MLVHIRKILIKKKTKKYGNNPILICTDGECVPFLEVLFSVPAFLIIFYDLSTHIHKNIYFCFSSSSSTSLFLFCWIPTFSTRSVWKNIKIEEKCHTNQHRTQKQIENPAFYFIFISFLLFRAFGWRPEIEKTIKLPVVKVYTEPKNRMYEQSKNKRAYHLIATEWNRRINVGEETSYEPNEQKKKRRKI